MNRPPKNEAKKITVRNKQSFPKRKTAVFESQCDGAYHWVHYVCLAIVLTVKDLFLQCRRCISASSSRVVTRSCTNRENAFTSPVVWDLFMSLIVGELLRLKARQRHYADFRFSSCRLPSTHHV